MVSSDTGLNETLRDSHRQEQEGARAKLQVPPTDCQGTEEKPAGAEGSQGKGCC